MGETQRTDGDTDRLGRKAPRREELGRQGWIEGNYKNDKQDGRFVEYYKNGLVKKKECYKDGKQEGKLVWYDLDGNITDEDIWKDGECVEMCEGNE